MAEHTEVVTEKEIRKGVKAKKDESKRAYALDALRGIAILLMILSGSIPFGNALPAWMYHAQVPPPNHIFNPNLPGITWVDLVFPFFLFAMGAAFPLAIRKKLENGISIKVIICEIITRGLLLAGFAIFIQHVKPFVLSENPGTLNWLTGIAGFIILFPILLRTSGSVKPYIKWGIKTAGVFLAVFLLCILRYPNGTGFLLTRSDIIILVLANVAFFGSLLWLATKDNLLLRIGIMGVLIAIRLTQNVDGSWNHWLWNSSPFPWLYKLYYLQYLFIIIPGTILGDQIYKWIKENKTISTKGTSLPSSFMYTLGFLMSVIPVINVIGLFSRQIIATLIADTLFISAGYMIFSTANAEYEKLLKSIFNWGVYWLILGLFFEAYEGGIKKDHPTMSYYFVTSGLAIFTYIGLSVLIDHFRKSRYLNIIIENGQNPMIAYIAGSNFIMPILALTSVGNLLSELLSTPWLGFIKGVIFTCLVALLTSFFTNKKLYWRT
jgi:predicted acyltransferase